MITVYIMLCALPATLIIYLVGVLVRYFAHKLILKKIPSPPGHWLWGNLYVIRRNPDDLFQYMRNLAKDYWPIYTFNAVFITTINLLHPCDVEIVLSNMKHLSKSKVYTLLESWLGKGLLTSTGKKWQHRRKILTPAFHFNILQQFLTVFNEETDKLVKQIEESCDKPYIDVVPFITQLAFQSIGETAMGLSKVDKATYQKYKESIHLFVKIILKKIAKPWCRVPFIYSFTQMKEEEFKITEFLHDFSYQVIRSRESQLLKSYSNGQAQNSSYFGRKLVRMLDLLLMVKMEGGDIDLKGIREEVDTFMFEGHDTTSVAITFLLLLLANHREIQETVSQEINDVLGSSIPTYENLQELRYTERVIKEALRLYPSVPFISRLASEDFTTFTGYYIPKGSVLHMHIFDIHRDPRIYPDPLKFDPDRFLPENSQRHPFAYIPFSAGPRNCIGQRFAMLEMKSVLCGILRRFSLEEVDKPDDIGFYPDLVLRPKTAVRIRFVPK